jgi:PAS domain S-box-containing protein
MPDDLRTLLGDLTVAAQKLPRGSPASMDEFGRMLEALPVAALGTDNHGRYVMANAAACTLTGYTLEELKRLSVWDLTLDSKEHEADRLWRTFLEQREQSGEYPLVTKDKRIAEIVYVARINLMPGLNVSLLKIKPAAASRRTTAGIRRE